MAISITWPTLSRWRSRPARPSSARPITIETAVELGLPPQQAITVTGGETLHFGDVSVDVGLAHHSQPAEGIQAALAQLYKVELPPDTPEEAKISAAVRARGTFAPDVITKGTMAFGLTFPNGFKVLDLDSAGPITEGDRTLAQKLGPVDVAIIAYQAHAVAERQVGETFPLVQLFRPKLYLPSHHDASFGSWIDLGIEPCWRRSETRCQARASSPRSIAARSASPPAAPSAARW